MRVINIHKRTINQPKAKVSLLFKTLATNDDEIWPSEKWPAMRFNEGLKVGAKGGHGIVRYTIVSFKEGEHIKFKFTKPEGFIGTHKLMIKEFSDIETEMIHEIKMNTSFKRTILWTTVIRWLHDALIEDAFDKVENHFSSKVKETKYNFWVKYLRQNYKRKLIKRNAIVEAR